MSAHAMGWQIVGEPEQHGDDWSVVFRMDALERDAAGPRIFVTATAWSQAEEIEVLGDGDEPEIAVCGVVTHVDYEVLGPDGRAIARYQEPNPAVLVLESDSATIDSARECAEETVSEFAEEPDQWRWDGSAEALTAGTRLRLRAWRVASETEEDGDDWVVVFRMDNEEPDSEGPQIVVTGSPMSSGDEEDDDEREDEEDEDEEDDEEFVSYGNSTDFEYQIWGPDGKLVARLRREDPNEYHSGWESESFEEASDRALSAVQEFAANPGYWKWDGTAESRGLEPVRPKASR